MLGAPGEGARAEAELDAAYAQARALAADLSQLQAEHRATRADLARTAEALQQAQEQLRANAAHILEVYVRLEHTYLGTLTSLARAVEQRDGSTGGHCNRVVRYADLLGEALQLSALERRQLCHGALLHDIGKIGIPDAILRSPGPLLAEEWAVMRQHPALGVHLIEGVDFLEPAIPIVLTHHEAWDGSGYPDGLRGEQIPFGSRIFQVADALDAIVSDRPYRSRRSLEVALAEIRRHAGSQFDPAVVQALETIAPRIEAALLDLEGLSTADLSLSP